MVRVLTQPEPGWQRIDDSDRNIIFEGENWFSGYSKYSDNYLKTFHYKSSSQPSNSVRIKFSFVGTKLRLIGLVNNGGYDRYATIVIDGNTERLDYDAWEGTRQAVIYEKTNLNKGPHTVTILGTYLNLDAIDIDSDGYVFTPKKVGEILDKPDPGWNRFDDADSLIKYGDGAWNRVTDDRYYNSTVIYSLTKSVVEFSFKGTGVRLVSKSVNLGYGPVDITIDGVKESYNPVLGSDNWKVLLYNKEGLKNEFHSVKLEGPEGIIMDAIDVLDGELVKTAKVGDVLLQPETGWKRIDDTDVNIKYSGNWTLIDNLSDYHNSTARFKHAKQSSVDDSAMSATFKFKGTKLRVIGVSNNTYDREAQIIIDGKPETISFYANRDVSPTRVLLFDKQGLTDEIHTVELNGVFMHLDAIDIDENGSMIPPTKVGDVLLQPEAGWKRIDDTHSNIQYTGNWSLIDNQPLAYNSTIRFKNSKTPEPVDNSAMSLTFRFKGTKFRVIGVSNNTYDKDAQIIIDGKPETISFYAERDISPHRTLLFDKQGLTDEIHIVELKGVFMALDAIDIDENGSMVPPAKVGDVLLQPESRWTRFDDRHSLIKYGSGTWELATDSRYYNSTNTFSRVSCDIEFSFKGTGLRIVSKMITTTSGYGPVDVLIDGVTEKYSITGSSDQWQTLLYEKQGLPDAVHSVKLVAPNGIIMDAIDVLDGQLEKTSAKVGDQLLQPEDGWKRIDDTDANIKYLGNWKTTKESNNFNSTIHYNTTSGVQVSYQFEFSGSKLRIIGFGDAGYDKSAKITIDGITEDIVYYQSKSGSQIIVYEKLNLKPGTHTVKVEGSIISLDAIDIEDTGSMVKSPVEVGDILLQPEFGWDRLNNSDPSITYTKFIRNTDDNGIRKCYMNDYHYAPNEGTVNLEFTGTGFRVLGIVYRGYSSNISIEIDGVKATFSEDYPVVGSYLQGSTLVYEMTNLENKKHTVKIYNSDITKGLGFDAFDIKSGDTVKLPAKVGDILLEPEPGWKRIDDADTNIKYDGKWALYKSDDYYNSTLHYKYKTIGTDPASIRFNFYGTKLRIIGILAKDYDSNATITIDGKIETINFSATQPKNQAIVYEKLNLPLGNHSVKLDGIFMNLDAIDIDSDDSMVKPPAKVGDILLEPEPGWKRIDDADTNIKYDGKWALYKSDDYYNSTLHYKYKTIGTDPASIRFNFYGTKLRIIGILAKDYDSNATITIDGKTETINFSATQPKNQAIVYEKLNLPLGNHSVKLDGIFMNLDAIDIDSDDSMVKPTAKVGDQLLAPEDGWKRYDDNASEILYDANWAKNVAYSGAYGGKSTSAHKGKNSSFRFKFKGTKFRLIVGCSTTEFYSDKISVRIDDLPLEFFNANAPKDTNQVLKYEKLGLEDKEHEVKVSVVTSQPGAASYDYRFDALDIDDTGSLIKINTVGDVLTEPEKGWKRIDDTDPLIRYIGNWKLTTGNDKHYNKTTHYNLDKKLDTSFEFEFVGTKLRLLAYGDSGYDATSKVLIDGKEETMIYNSPSGNQVIRYEKLGLDRGKHTVKVIGKAMSLDSIDIDADGYLLARLGDKLVEPEPGWVRFDDTHKNIEYNGFWKTTEGDVSCYNNTHHWKSKEDNNDSTISARFLFKGTKFRLISMTSPSYPEDIELKIDGQKEILKLSGEDMQYQTLAYEKKNLEDMIHVIELSGKYISIDAIDLEEGATLLKLPDEKLKPYQIRSGLIFKDDFDTFDSRWIASPVGSYSLIDRKGYFRMLHNVSRDTLLLADLPNEKEFAFEVSADYTPTHEDDKGGIIVWKNGEENIEFLETEDGTRETTELKWMACKDNEDWTFFSDYGEGFNFYDSDRMNCSKFGVVLKKGSNSKFVNLDIDSIIATRGRKLTIANIAPNISVQMEDEFGGIIFNGNTGYNTGIQITLPSLEFTGKVILTNVEGKELGVIKTTFYGGDVYGFGSNLEIKFSGEELSTLAQTRLPDMISGKSEIMLELVNPSVARANNVNLSIAQYEDKFGWSWADIALDSNGKPGQYQDSINIPYVNPENTIKFWLKVTKGTDYVGLAPLQFQIHLEHE